MFMLQNLIVYARATCTVIQDDLQASISCFQIIHAEFEEEESAFVLTVNIAKVGRRPKPKALPAPLPKTTVTAVKKTPPPSPGKHYVSILRAGVC